MTSSKPDPRRPGPAASLALAALVLVSAPACSQRYRPGQRVATRGAAPASLAPVQETIAGFKAAEPRLGAYFDDAHAYAVLPTIGKGAFIVGGAHGKGRVFRGGRLVGNVTVTKLSVGFQWGGQAYSQLIFFRDAAAFARFKTGKTEFGARASAVAVDAGVSADRAWSDGVAVFTRAKGGLMAEAAVGGQKYRYLPL